MAEWNEQQDRAKELDNEKKAQAYQREVDSRSQLQDQVCWCALYMEKQRNHHNEADYINCTQCWVSHPIIKLSL